MKAFIEIVKREYLAYLRSPMAYVLCSFFLFILGYLFSVTLDFERKADMATLFRDLGLFMLFLAPIVTMRLLAEDRRSHMLDVLLSEAISPLVLVLAKYGAAMLLLVTILLPTLVYPSFLVAWGAPDLGPILTAYVGVLLLGAAYLAVGLFASAISRSQITAAMVTFALLVFFWIIGWGVATFGQHADEAGPSLRQAFEPLRVFVVHSPENLSLYSHYDRFVRGLLDSRSVLFFLSTAVLFLFLATRFLTLDAWRLPASPRLMPPPGNGTGGLWSRLLLAVCRNRDGLGRFLLERRKAILFTGLAYGLLSCGIWAATNHLSFRFARSWDLTATGRRSLQPETVDVLANLKDPLEIITYFKTSRMLDELNEVLRNYRDASPRIRIRHLDPDRDSGAVKELFAALQLEDMRTNSIIVRYRGRFRQITSDEITEPNRRRRMEWGYAGPLYGAERTLTGCIEGLLRPSTKRIVFLTGHGERPFDMQRQSLGRWISDLRRENVFIGHFNPGIATAIQDGCDLVIAAGPTEDYSPSTLDLLARHLAEGGSLLVLVDDGSELPGLESLLERHGIRLGPGPVEDPKQRLARGPATAFVTMRWGDHVLTQGLRESNAVVVGARIVDTSCGHHLLFASPSATTSTPTTGALPLASLVVSDELAPGLPAPPASSGDHHPFRVAAIGDVDMASNLIYEAGGNRRFLLRLVSTLLRRETAPSFEAARSRVEQPLILTRRQKDLLLWTNIAVLPLGVLFCGLIAWRFRGRE